MRVVMCVGRAPLPYLSPSYDTLFCSVLEFGPVPTSPTPLLQGAPVL